MPCAPHRGAHTSGSPTGPARAQAHQSLLLSLGAITVAALGIYRDELIDEGVTPDTAEQLMMSAADDLRYDDLVVKPPNRPVGEVAVKLVPQLDHHDIAQVVADARDQAAASLGGADHTEESR